MRILTGNNGNQIFSGFGSSSVATTTSVFGSSSVAGGIGIGLIGVLVVLVGLPNALGGAHALPDVP